MGLCAAAALAGGAWSAQPERFGFTFADRQSLGANEVAALVPSPGGDAFVAAVGRRLLRFAIDDEGRVVTPLPGFALPEVIASVAVSPDGQTVAALDARGDLHLVAAESGRPSLHLGRKQTGRARTVAFSSDGRYLLAGGRKGEVNLFTPTGQWFASLAGGSGHREETLLLADLAGSGLLSVGRDRQILLWDPSTQRVARASEVDLGVVSAAVGGGILALGLEHVAGNRFRGAKGTAFEIEATDVVRLIDASEGTLLRDLEGAGQRVDAVAVTPDGRFVAAGGSDESVLVWDTATGKLVHRIPFAGDVTALAFSPDGRFMSAGTSSGELAVLLLEGVGPAPIAENPGKPASILIILVQPEGLSVRNTGAARVPEVTTRSLRVQGRIKTDRPLKSLLVDGREVTSISLGEEGDYLFTAYVSTNEPGRREVEIVAEDHGGARAAERFAVNRVPAPEAVEAAGERRAGRRLALIVGISEYRDPSVNLDFADDDASGLHRFLTSPRLGPAAFQPEDTLLLLNEQATAAEINTGLRDFLQRATENDFVLFFFAGHGVPDPNRIQDLYLMAHDTDPENVAGTGMLMRHIREAVASIQARDVVILTDACHSAGLAAPESIRSLTVNPIHDVFLEKMRHSSGGLAILTASEAAQVSLESERWERHGVFTHFLLRGLEGAADDDGDRIVSLGEVMEFVREQVKRETGARQIPAIGPTSFDRELPLAPVLDR